MKADFFFFVFKQWATGTKPADEWVVSADQNKVEFFFSHRVEGGGGSPGQIDSVVMDWFFLPPPRLLIKTPIH